MSEELLPLRDEHLAQYESIINKIRESDKYKKLQKIRESEINEYNAAIAETDSFFSKKLYKEEKKLIRSIFADFEKNVQEIPGATIKKKQNKKNFFQRIFSKK